MGTKELAFDETYHIHVVRHALTKNIAARFPEVQDEINKAFVDLVKDNTKPGDGLFKLSFISLTTMADG